MTEIERKLKELEQSSKLHEKNIEKLFEEIEDLRRGLEKERDKNKQLLQSKYNSNNNLIEDNNRYAKSYEDKYIEVIERIGEIEQRLK